MSRYFLFIAASTVLFISCKSKVTSVSSGSSKTENTDQKIVSSNSKTSGRVSHQYRETGCATVVIVKTGEENDLILIPTVQLNEFDKDGLKISFNYRKLRMPNPKGCVKGIPAELTDISKN